ncbi:universal stress protein [Bartonella sp. CB189]|uniref:universal stress protein n=1 Tax=Bartonella sp. CB189 TaxID=3112254 RepID=UPI002F968B94
MVSERKRPKENRRRKILVIIDETPECRCAVSFAAQHAKNTNRTLVLLSIIDNSEFQHFLGVDNIMRTELTQNAYETQKKIADDMRDTQICNAEMIVREGKKIDEIFKLISEDKEIALVVLAASEQIEGPGPLVQLISHRETAFSIPVIVIPSNLSDEDIESLA